MRAPAGEADDSEQSHRQGGDLVSGDGAQDFRAHPQKLVAEPEDAIGRKIKVKVLAG